MNLAESWLLLKGHPEWAGGFLLFSVLLLTGSVLLAPRILAELPHDYFLNPHHRPLESFRDRPLLRMGLLLIKNLFAVILGIAGLAMLVLPGQGLLTLLVALILLDFPGKFALKRKLIRIPFLHRLANKLRKLRGKAEFQT
ncbi:MAG: hypothetical protein ACO3N7_07735 [Kiritimatiellia bacterium]